MPWSNFFTDFKLNPIKIILNVTITWKTHNYAKDYACFMIENIFLDLTCIKIQYPCGSNQKILKILSITL